MQDDEKPYFDKVIASLSEQDRQRAEEDPLDVLIVVRGFADEKQRVEATLEAMRKICEWRAAVGYYDFLHKRLDRASDFYKWWPESIHGCDKYGHFLQCLCAGSVDADSLEKVNYPRREPLIIAEPDLEWSDVRYTVMKWRGLAGESQFGLYRWT